MGNFALQFSITFLFACIVCVVVTWLIRYVTIRWHIFDIPDQNRKIHAQPVPLWGGVGIYLAMVIVITALHNAGWFTDDRVSLKLLVGLLAAGFVLVVGGMLDDTLSLRWWQQVAFPIVATGIMLGSGLDISFVTNPFGGGLLYLNTWQVPLPGIGGLTWYITPVADVLLIAWILGMVYTTKLLDGVDGLVSSISFVASVVIFIVSLSWDRSGSTTSFLSIALAGVAAGFLVWNWYPAKIFLGEGGSILFGFMLAVLAVISGGKIATALLVMGIPILDVAWIIVRRLRSGQKIYIGDAGHLHFRLLRAGLSQRQVVLLLSLLALLFGSVSFFFTTRVKLIALGVLLIVMLVLGLLLTRYYGKEAPQAK